jgi:PAS domain S-box-containing protein
VRTLAVLLPGHEHDWSRVMLVETNITDEVEANRNMAASERRYRELLDQIPVAIWVEDWSAAKPLAQELRNAVDGSLADYLLANRDVVRKISAAQKVILINQSAISMYGVSDSSELETWEAESFPFETRARLMAQELEGLLAGDASISYRIDDVTRPDGSQISLAGTLNVMSDHRDAWSRVLIAEQDVTAEVDADRERQAAEGQFRELFEQSPLSIWENDWSRVKLRLGELRNDGVGDLESYLRERPDAVMELGDLVRVTGINAAATNTYGIKDRAAVISGEIPIPESADELEKFIRCLVAFDQETYSFNHTAEEETFDGRKIMVRNSMMIPETHWADWARVVIQADDITEQYDAQTRIEESERRYRELFEQSPVAILEANWSGIRSRLDELIASGTADIDAHLRARPDLVQELFDCVEITDMNAAAMRLFGIASQAELAKGARDLPPTHDQLEAIIDFISAFLRGEMPEREVVQQTYDYRLIVARTTGRIPEASLESWGRVVFLLEDITEEREIRSRVEASERRYRELFEQAPIGIRVDDWSHIKRRVERLFLEHAGRVADYLIGNREELRKIVTGMRIMDVNEGCLRIYGTHDPAELEANRHVTLSDDLLDEFARVLEQLAQGGGFIRRGETAETLKDGSVIYTRGTVMVPAEFREDWARVILTIEDVTEVHRTRSAMEASERRYQELFNQSPVAIWVEDWSTVKEMLDALGLPDREDQVEYINQHPEFVDNAYAAMKLLEINEMAWRQRRAESRSSLMKWSEEPLPESERSSVTMILQALAAGQTHIALPDLRQKRLDGSEYYERSIALVPPEFERSWKRIIHVMEDVTPEQTALQELSESRYMMELAQRMTGHGHYVHDTSQDELIETSESLNRIFSISDTMFHHNNPIVMDIVHPDDREHVAQVLERSARTREAVDFEYRIVRTDGQVRHLRELCEFLPDTSGINRNRRIGTVHDVTEERRAEIALRNARDEAERASNAKTEFLATISHELRTPLNAIIGFSDVILEGMFGPLANPRYDEYVRDINESGRHLLELINDILDLAKAEAGRLELHEEVTDMCAVVALSVKLFRERAERSGMQLKVTVPDALPGLYADARKIRQMLLNLLSNAVKFTPDHGRIDVRIELRPDGGLDLVVEDTGIGMSQDDMERAFEVFGQADSTLTRRYEGTGLGLPLARAVVRLHGGDLLMRSQPGMGTMVTARFPAERTREEIPRRRIS